MRNREWFLMWCIIGSKLSSKSFSTKRSFTVDPILMFLSGSGRTVKVNKSVYIA